MHTHDELPSNVIQATDATFAKELQRPGVVLVDFYADWCGPCQVLSPTLHRIIAQHPEATLLKVDVDANPRVSQEFQIMSIPTVLAFKNGTLASDPIMGAQRPIVYDELLRRLADAPSGPAADIPPSA